MPSQEQIWLEQAKVLCKRKPDDSFDEPRLLDALTGVIRTEWDTEAEIFKKAKRIVNATAKPGGTDPDGQLNIPGLLPYDFEPWRMVRDDNGGIVENNRARLDFKSADSRRAHENVIRAVLWADRKQREYEIYSQWTVEQLAKGRKPLELTWGECIRDKNLLT